MGIWQKRWYTTNSRFLYGFWVLFLLPALQAWYIHAVEPTFDWSITHFFKLAFDEFNHPKIPQRWQNLLNFSIVDTFD
jgi:hypothetical protein